MAEVVLFLYICIITIPVAKAIDFYVCSKTIKTIADLDYKFDSKKIEMAFDKNNSLEKHKKIRCIPFVNIIYALATLIDYKKKKSSILNELKKSDMVMEFSKGEKKLYQENPTGLRALIFHRLNLEESEKLEKHIAIQKEELETTINKIEEILKDTGIDLSRLEELKKGLYIYDIKKISSTKHLEHQERINNMLVTEIETIIENLGDCKPIMITKDYPN